MPMTVPRDLPILEVAPKDQGQHIVAIRGVLGMTRTDLAEELGITYNTLTRWETGHIRIGNMRMVLLAMAYLATQRGLNAGFVFASS